MGMRPYGYSQRALSKRVDVACCVRQIEPLISLTTSVDLAAAIHSTCSTLPAHLGMGTSVRRPGASADHNHRYNNRLGRRRRLLVHNVYTKKLIHRS